jgi:hypothetical protein
MKMHFDQNELAGQKSNNFVREKSPSIQAKL